METLLWLICIIFTIVIGLQKSKISNLELRDEESKHTLLKQREHYNDLLKILERTEGKVVRKNAVIKFLGERNIYLESLAGNVSGFMQGESEVIKDAKVKAAYNLFLQTLQTSKEI